MTVTAERPACSAMNPAPRPRYVNDLTLAALPSAVTCARVFVVFQLREWGVACRHIGQAEDTAAELVASAVGATGIIDEDPLYGDAYNEVQVVGIRLRLVDQRLHIEVWDSSPNEPVPLVPMRLPWQYYYAKDGGKVVWCEMPTIRSVTNDDPKEPSTLPRRLKTNTPTRQVPIECDPALLKRVLDGLLALSDD